MPSPVSLPTRPAEGAAPAFGLRLPPLVLPLLLVALLAVVPARPAGAVMPPEHYAGLAEGSAIKAVAVVQSVTVEEWGEYETLRRVVFLPERGLTPDTPEAPDTFTGRCRSADTGKTPPAGGTLYFYPAEGERVYVTVTSEGGAITSYTPLNPELERALEQGPGFVQYRMGRAVPMP